MTNADYIKEQLTRLSDRELAAIVYEYFGMKTSGRNVLKFLRQLGEHLTSGLVVLVIIQILLKTMVLFHPFGHGKDGAC